MTATLAPDLHVLDEDLLDHLAAGESGEALERLRQAGYLLLAVPVELGGLGGNLVQAADQQRRLARHAPDVALAVTMHLAWTGVAADLLRDGDASLRWILESAASGEVYTAHPEGTGDAAGAGLSAWMQCLTAAVLLGVADGDLALVPAYATGTTQLWRD